MHSHDYTIAHFEQMKELAVRLAELPAEIRLHEYNYEVFGSWILELRFKGIRFRLVYDGKENELRLDNRDVPRDASGFGPHVWRSPRLAGEAFYTGVLGALKNAVQWRA